MFNKERNFRRGESILMVLIIAVLITAFSYSASITVINPHSGSIWHQGYTYTIKWTKSGTMNENVKIRLYQGSTKILKIVDSTLNNGSFDWEVPADLSDGTYYIRVKTIDNLVYDNGDTFSIAKLSAKTDIRTEVKTIAKPKSEFTLEKTFASKMGKDNKTVDIFIKVRNKGNVNTHNVSYMFKIDGPPGILDEFFFEDKFAFITAGGSAVFHKKYYFKKSGNYKIYFIVNYRREYEEEYYNDDIFVKNIKIEGLPDLIVCVDNNKRPKVGKKSYINFYVKNKGETNSNPCNLVVYVKDRENSIFKIPSLLPGKSYKVKKFLKAWWSKGEKLIKAYIDKENIIPEIDELNNYVRSSVYVRSPFESAYTTKPSVKCSNRTTYYN